MTPPSVSVVIPTHGRQALLQRAVRAVAAQDYEGPIECLVVFDRIPIQPVDWTATESRTIRYLPNDRSPGLAGARNTGIQAATSQIVAHCDDDDVWLSGKVRKQVEAMHSHSEAHVVTTGISVEYEGRTFPRPASGGWLRHADLLNDRHMEAHSSTILAKREAYEDVGLLDEGLPSYVEDYDWLLRASAAQPIWVVSEPLVRVLFHRDSYFDGKWDTQIAALRHLLEKYPELERSRRGAARIYGQLSFFNAAAGRRRDAWRYGKKALERNPLERRVYVSMLVSMGLVKGSTVLHASHRRGKGI